jgi:hypothetical protein
MASVTKICNSRSEIIGIKGFLNAVSGDKLLKKIIKQKKAEDFSSAFLVIN